MRQVSFFNILARPGEIPHFVAGQEVGCDLLWQNAAQLSPDCGRCAGGGGLPPAWRVVAPVRLHGVAAAPAAARLQETPREVRLAGPGVEVYWLSSRYCSKVNLQHFGQQILKHSWSGHLISPISTNKLGMTEDPLYSLENNF